jgi:hypothetical protein
MTGGLEKQLDALLDQYDEARRSAQAREEGTRAEERRFVEDFAALRASVLRPLFEAAGAILARRGHAFRIREHEFAPQPGRGAAAEASIELYVAPDGIEKPAPADEHRRTLSFATRHYNRTVCVKNGAVPHEGASAGAKGANPLARIDLELAEVELLKLMSAIVRA